MTASSFNSQISDELLSAYLDGVVSVSERTLVETALQSDPTVAWRLDTLRQTVQLLRSLRQASIPASFSSDAILAAVQQESGPSQQSVEPRRTFLPEPQPTVWQRLLDFWRSGSPMLRNAAVSAFALFLVIGIGSQFISAPGQPAASTAQFAPAQAPSRAITQQQESAPVTAVSAAPGVAPLAAPEAPLGEAATQVEQQGEMVAESALAAKSADASDELAEGSAAELTAANVDDVTAQETSQALAVLSVPSTEETANSAIASSIPGDQARIPAPSLAASAGQGGEDVTGLDAALMESVPMQEGAALGAAPAERGGGAVLPAAPPAPAAQLTAQATSTPTSLPTATSQPTLTATPVTAALAQPAVDEPASSPPSAAKQSTTGLSWLWLVQWAAALAAVSFLALWLRSRHPSS